MDLFGKLSNILENVTENIFDKSSSKKPPRVTQKTTTSKTTTTTTTTTTKTTITTTKKASLTSGIFIDKEFYKNLPYWRNQTPLKNASLFTDPLFKPNANSLLSKDDNGKFIDPVVGPQKENRINTNKIGWKRASEIFNGNYLLFEDTIDMSDINQGTLGDCYFLSSVAAMTEFPNLIYQIFKTKSINKYGYYELIFFIDGQWQIVIIDDYLPIDLQKGTLSFSRTKKSEIWVPLLEKAWAKINGGYTNIISGWMHHCLQAFTGFPSIHYSHANYKIEDLYKAISFADRKNCIITSSSQKDATEFKDSDNEANATGLINSHAYTVIGCNEIISKGKKINLLKIRNPWGFKEWKGDWGDDSELWGVQERKQVGFEKKEDGIFFMSMEDYFKYFLVTEICYIAYNSNSKIFRVENEDLNKGNVFNIYLKEDGLFSVSLIRKMYRFNRELSNKIIPSLLVIIKYDPYKNDPENYFTEYEARNESFEDISYTTILKKGFYLIYTYHNKQYSEIKEDFYYVKFDCEKEFLYKKMHNDTEDFALLRKIVTQGVCDAKKFDKTKDFSSFVTSFKKDGLGHRVIYNSKEKYMKYTEDISNVKNMFMLVPHKEKGDKEPFVWYIPPKNFGIILGMEKSSKLKSTFGLSAKACLVNKKPNDYNDEDKYYKIDVMNYANNSVLNSDYKKEDYYDYKSMNLTDAKKILKFKKIEDAK